MEFTLNLNTKIVAENPSVPVDNAIKILTRDMQKVLTSSDVSNSITLLYDSSIAAEQYAIGITQSDISLRAADDLGFIYALLHISDKYLGIKPFWFWLDQAIQQRESVKILCGNYCSPVPIIRYRGWFFNDEVLIMKWENGLCDDLAWKMAFEALLRCGGNMAIPGTDKLAHKNHRLAAKMGLWLTHHHAEPLGAEMLARAYPGQDANFLDNTQLFYKLWEDAVIRQKNYNVVWNLCFRGQGDCPFWSSDTSGRFDTPEKRGALITEVIEKQCEIVKKHVKNPVFCTNLYGEIMELYNEGYIKLSDDIIKVRADNGYGKMVTRRRDNHDVRISSMPDKYGGRQGIYYHVSFYDLQAANHLTMLPNSVDFVNRELNAVIDNNGVDFWVINCSNIRPHAYFLDAIRKKWFGLDISGISHSRGFASDYGYPDADCFVKYAKAMTAYSSEEDEHAGEQFYTETARMLAHRIITDRTQPVAGLFWLTGKTGLSEQIMHVKKICEGNIAALREYHSYCRQFAGNRLFDSTVLLQAKIHCLCADGLIHLCTACEKFLAADYKSAFLAAGDSAMLYKSADAAMRGSEYGVWKGFYANDCLADIKHSAYMAEKLMGFIREFGDNARHDKWYRETIYSPEDRNVFLLLVTDNHMTDDELYNAMKKERID